MAVPGLERGPGAVGWSPWRIAAALAALAGLGLAWRLSGLEPESLGGLLAFFREPPLGPVVASAVFTVACLAMVPVVALTVAAGLAFDPGLALGVAWSGSVAAATLGYGVGSLLWRDAVQRLAGERLSSVSRAIARRGILASALLRVVPVAPFMLVNLVAGASHVRARDFVVGTALGMLPGAALLIFAADRLSAALREPTAATWLWAVLALLALLGAIAAVRRLLARRTAASSDAG